MAYRRIYKPEHPKSDVTGYIGEHRLIMEKILGRPLGSDEVTHHKDFHKPNNDPSNLQLMTRKEHQQIPLMQARYLVKIGLMDIFFEWWEKNKHAPKTPEQLLEIQLINELNKADKLTRKLEQEHEA